MCHTLRLILFALVACLLLPAVGSAAERNFSLRYSNNVNGQIIFAANTMLQCPLNTVDPLVNSGCSGARAGTNARNNNSFDMGWIDIDSDPSTFDSSSAQLLLPGTGHVLFAGLYWTGVQKKGDTVSGANGYKGVPQNAPDANAIGSIKLQVPGVNGYTAITGSVDTAQIASGGGYTAFADVTELVNAAGAGTYTAANLQTGTGGNTDAGWTIVVAYSDSTEPLRNLSVFDGLKVVSATNFVDIPLSGFKTPGSGTVKTTLGVVAAEGDAGVSGDYLALNDQRLTDAVHPADNTENSTIATRGVQVTTKSPDYRNQLGYDASLFQADGYLTNNATTAMFRAKTNGETYAPQAITFATELYSPNVTLTKSATTGQDFPGAAVTYTITATNNGTGDATNVQLKDPLPAGVTYVSGPVVTSGTGNVTGGYDATTNTIVARLGTGASTSAGGTLGPNESASITYQVNIDGAVALGDTIANVATLGFVSTDLGLPITTVAESDIVVRYPDPGITKTVTSASWPNYMYNLVVTNQGSIPTTETAGNEITVRDGVPPRPTAAIISAVGVGWTCSATSSSWIDCSRATGGTLAAGASYPPIVVTATYSAAPVINTATVTGGSQPTAAGSPALLNDSTTAAVDTPPNANLAIIKTALSDTISLGDAADFQIQVRNTGPDTATNVVVTDPLGPDLLFDSATTSQGSCSTAPSGAQTILSCAVGSLANGYGATILVHTRPSAVLAGAAVQTVSNTATVTSQISQQASATATLDVRPSADVSVTKTGTPAVVNQGAAVTYTVDVTNNGPGTATGLQVVDTLPAAIDPGTIVTPPPGGATCTVTGLTVSCLWSADVNAGDTRTVTIDARMLTTVPVADRESVNQVRVYTTTDDNDLSNNAAMAEILVVPAADLVANAGGPATITAGATGDLTFTADNDGPSDATGTAMTITLPTGLKPTAAPAGCTIGGQVVTCAMGTIIDGDTGSVTIKARAADDLDEAARTTTVSITSDVPDPFMANNTDIAPLVAGPVADLTITKVADVAKVAPGGTISYTIGVANAGGSTSTGAVVKDNLPEGLTVTSATTSNGTPCTVVGRLVTCTAEEIVPHGSFQILIVAKVGKNRAGATFVNTAKLTPGPETDPKLANNTASATVHVKVPKGSTAKLKITGQATPNLVYPQVRVMISFTVTNTAKVVANGVRVCITVPPSLKYLSSKGKKSGKQGICFTRDQLKSKKSATFSYTALTKQPGPVRPRGSAWAGNAARVSAVATLGVLSPGGNAGGVTG